MNAAFRICAAAAAIAGAWGAAGAARANDDVLALQEANVVQPSLTYNGWNYSPLDQINTGNVADLTLAWTLQVGVLDQFEASPLVVGDAMYIVTPVNQSEGGGQSPNTVLAIDLNTQSIIWEFRPDIDRQAALQACCGSQTRGMQYAEGKIFFHTLDGQVFALDAETGEALWRSLAADVTIREHTAGNGIVIGDLYIIGNTGGEFGVRGKVSAFDINDGQTQWVMYSMGPDNEVGIGPRFNTFYTDDQQGSLNTWWGDSWRTGGGAVWGYFTADISASTFYYSTGNCGPWNPDYRREWGVVNLDENGGLIDYRNNWCASQMARDSSTGELLWAYNITPADMWDLDEPVITPLAELDFGAGPREIAMKAARNGYFYVWDRHTGELVVEPWPFVYVNFMTGVDMETGRALYDITRWAFTDLDDRRSYTDYEVTGVNDRDDYTGTEIDWCPGSSARNWQNDAWSPVTGLLYTSTNTGCATQVVLEGEYVAGQGYTLRRGAGGDPVGDRWPHRTDANYGEFTELESQIQANNPVTSETVWHFDAYDEGNNAPIMASAGGLVWQGAGQLGQTRAYDAANGDLLWSFTVGSEFSQSPVSYIGPDGRQYIAIIASASTTVRVDFDDPAEADQRYARAGATLFVFALPYANTGGI